MARAISYLLLPRATGVTGYRDARRSGRLGGRHCNLPEDMKLSRTLCRWKTCNARRNHLVSGRKTRLKVQPTLLPALGRSLCGLHLCISSVPLNLPSTIHHQSSRRQIIYTICVGTGHHGIRSPRSHSNQSFVFSAFSIIKNFQAECCYQPRQLSCQTPQPTKRSL